MLININLESTNNHFKKVVEITWNNGAHHIMKIYNEKLIIGKGKN